MRPSDQSPSGSGSPRAPVPSARERLQELAGVVAALAADICSDPGAREVLGPELEVCAIDAGTEGCLVSFAGLVGVFEFRLAGGTISFRILSAPTAEGVRLAYRQKQWPEAAAEEMHGLVTRAAGLIAEFVAEVRVNGQPTLLPLEEAPAAPAEEAEPILATAPALG